MTLSLIARLAVYISVGAAFSFASIVILGLLWGLTGPGWESNPPDIVASAFQVGLTAACALAGFWVCWFLIRVDRRDWWLGAGVASPWVASAAAIAIGYGLDVNSVPLVAGLLLCSGFPVAGSILGRSRQWPNGELIARAIGGVPGFAMAVVRSARDVVSDMLQLPRQI